MNYWTYDLYTNTSTNLATFNLVLQESLETQLSKPDILTADLSKIEVGLLKQKENMLFNLIHRDDVHSFPLYFWFLRPSPSPRHMFLGNCPPTPPLSQHFALSEK